MHVGWISSLQAGWAVAPGASRSWYGTVQARHTGLGLPGHAEVSDEDVLRAAITLCKTARAIVLASLLVGATALYVLAV
jgi:hypothetical protein